jgi:hypothetical protein
LCGCKKDTSPLDAPEIALTVANVGVTEAWLRLEVKNSLAGNQVTLQRNDSTIRQLTNFYKDSLIYDRDLQPGQSYTYQAEYQSSYQSLHAENQLTTLETTSHEFNWEILTFGEGGSSTLYDVCIINENDIWAVGEIWLRDSTDEFIHPAYNALHWNGISWLPLRITVRLQYEYNVIYTDADPIKTLFSPDNNEILFVSSAGGVTILENDNWKFLQIPYGKGPGGANKIWGPNSNNIYFVGSNGSIIHFHETNWQKIETGTELPIRDIWGIKNVNNDKMRILCTSSEKYQISERKIFCINSDDTVDELFWIIPRRLYSIWFNTKEIFFVCGEGVFRNSYEKLIVYNEVPNKFINRIRGYDLNNLFICGDFGLIAHYNGLKWKTFQNVELASGTYYSLDIHQNIVVAVGQFDAKQAVITIGRN